MLNVLKVPSGASSDRDVRQERRVARRQEIPGRLDVAHPERERGDAVGMDPQEARGARVLPLRARDEDADLPGAENRGDLAALFDLRGGGARHLGEAEARVKPAAAFEIGHDEMERVVAHDSERIDHNAILVRRTAGREARPGEEGRDGSATPRV